MNPLSNLDQWEDFVGGRYKEGKSESEFRQYDAEANPRVAEFYRSNHEQQTLNYVLGKEKRYFGLTRGKKSVWEAAEYLNTLIDDSDPDTDLTQIEHLLQTSGGRRRHLSGGTCCAFTRSMPGIVTGLSISGE